VSGCSISWTIYTSAPHSRQITMPASDHIVITGQMPFLPTNQQRLQLTTNLPTKCRTLKKLTAGVYENAHPLLLPTRLMGELLAFSKHSAVFPVVTPICTYDVTHTHTPWLADNSTNYCQLQRRHCQFSNGDWRPCFSVARSLTDPIGPALFSLHRRTYLF